MVQLIAAHLTVRELYADRLVGEGVLTEDEAEALATEVDERLREAHERLRSSFGASIPAQSKDERLPASTGANVVTAVAGDTLRALNEELLRVPDDFTVHPKLARQLERRRTTIAEGGIDWGQAEALAYASLLGEGIPVRLTGQDVERGTFSQRHLVLHDAETGELFTPM